MRIKSTNSLLTLTLGLLLATTPWPPAFGAAAGHGGGGGSHGGFSGGGFHGGFSGGGSHGAFGGGGFHGAFGGGGFHGAFGGGGSHPTFGGGSQARLSAGAFPGGFGGGASHSQFNSGSYHGGLTGGGYGGGFTNLTPGHSSMRSVQGGPSAGYSGRSAGFGGISGVRAMTPQTIAHGSLTTQARSVRNSFLSNAMGRPGYANMYRGGLGYPGPRSFGYGSFGYYPNAYGPYGWYGGWGFGYPWSWYVPGWSAATFWTFTGLSALTDFLGMGYLSDNSEPPASCNIVNYNGDNVYINGQPYASAQDYYNQAENLALAGKLPPVQVQEDGTGIGTNQSQEWKPLGVFALARPGQQDSDMILQMAINKDGILHGNYFNQLTNESLEIQGSLDRKTQRISWTIGSNPKTVFDAGLGDLINDQSTVLVHYGPDSTARMSLIRLQQPQASPPSEAQ
jgi:hypothetical protein